MSVLNVIANVVGTASMVTIPSDFHHTLSSAKMKFISLSFLLYASFSCLETRLIE